MTEVMEVQEEVQDVAAADQNGADTVNVGKSELAKLERQAKLMRRIKSQSRKCDEACAKYHAKKEEASALKKEYDLAVATLRRIISTGPDQLSLPGVVDDAAGEDASEVATEATTAQPVDKADDSWRPVSLATLGIPEKLLEKLAENNPPLTTIGEVADWTAGHKLTDVKGVGPAKAEAIEVALEQFWARRKEELASQEAEADAAPGTVTDADGNQVGDRAKRIRLTTNLTGFDNPEHGCLSGSEWDVHEWTNAGCPVIKSRSGIDVLLTEGEFVAHQGS